MEIDLSKLGELSQEVFKKPSYQAKETKFEKFQHDVGAQALGECQKQLSKQFDI